MVADTRIGHRGTGVHRVIRALLIMVTCAATTAVDGSATRFTEELREQLSRRGTVRAAQLSVLAQQTYERGGSLAQGIGLIGVRSSHTSAVVTFQVTVQRGGGFQSTVVSSCFRDRFVMYQDASVSASRRTIDCVHLLVPVATGGSVRVYR